MKKNNLLQGAIVALLVVSPLAAFAGQYPAADFEPKVLYQDESVKATPATTAKVVPVKEAPAVAVVASVDDSKYPAANFEPKVLFKDDAYKPSKSAPVSEYKTSAGAVIMEEAAVKASKSGSFLGLDESNLLLIALLAVAAGFIAFKNDLKCPLFDKCKAKKAAANTANTSVPSETGVARYLKAHDVSGVTKYLARVGKPTNVARYIAKQNTANRG